MTSITDSIDKLIEEFSKLPGIGQKSAQRLAFYVLKIKKEEAKKLAQAIVAVKEKVIYCSVCFNLTEDDPCKICKDKKRDGSIICVVEEANDVMAIEKTNQYKGLYHVLGGVLSPLDGIGPDELRIATAVYLSKLIKPMGIKVTRIARGLPAGGDLEYADMATLSRALEGRVEF